MILVVLCIITLRLQNELMIEIGFDRGFFPFMSLPVLYRGYFVYGFFIMLFLLLSSFSRRENAYVYIAAAIGTFVLSSCISIAVMFL